MSDTIKRASLASSAENGHAATPIHLLKEAEHELVLARQKLDLAARMRAEFLSKLSHEFRTPMTAIVGMTDLLLLGGVTADQRECLTTVRDAADNLMCLLNEVCDFARVEAGMLDFEWTGFRLRELIEQTIEPLAQRAHAKGLELIVSIGHDVPDSLVADPRRVGQIIDNLVESSIRLTRTGEVFLDVQRGCEVDDEVTLMLLVRDTGMGIAPEDQQRVFQPFLGSDSALKRRYPLSPLGLPLAAALVSALGGRLSLRSEPGLGACFEASIRLLKQNPTLSEREEAAGALPIEPLSGLGILIVDASATTRRTLADMTLAWRMRPTLAANLAEAAAECAACGSGRPAFILLEASQLAASPGRVDDLLGLRGGGRPVVLLMLRSDQHSFDSAQCESLGVTGTLHKPIFERKLLETLVTSLHGGAVKGDADKIAIASAQPNGSADREIEAAIERLGGDEQLYRELVQCFLDDTSEMIPKIRRAIHEVDAENLHRAAHSLKGLAASCGAVGVAEAAACLERLGREKQMGATAPAWAALEAALAASRRDLARFYATSK
jgi:HPt (histidine-containing phosphotransfer) domain-containing protein/nitrogen-specific signal transduction histidine kinase/CheY-like chemotaxis protein